MNHPEMTNVNPYAEATLPTASKKRPDRTLALLGALYAIFSAFPIAAMLALFFRFPVPLGGYMSGSDAVLPALVGVAIYGIFLGGFIVLGFFGAFTGALISSNTKLTKRTKNLATLVASIAWSTSFLTALSVLDRIIGTW